MDSANTHFLVYRFFIPIILMYYLFYLKTVEIAAWIKKYDSSRLVNSIVGGNHCVCCYVW